MKHEKYQLLGFMLALVLMPYSGGLARNIEQCLNDFSIPLRLSHTVVEIHGRERLEGVTIARVDEKRRPIPKELVFACMEAINRATVRLPARIGDVLIHDLLDTGVDVIVTANAD